MVSPSPKMNCDKAPHRTRSSSDIILMELRSCLDTLELSHHEEELSDCDSSNGSSNYKWLADSHFSRPSKAILDNMTVAELTDMCNKLPEKEVITVLRELQNLAHISSTANQLITQFKLYLSDTIAPRDAPESSTPPTVRRMSMSGMLAGIKNLRRKNSPAAHAAVIKANDVDTCSIETQHTSV